LFSGVVIHQMPVKVLASWVSWPPWPPNSVKKFKSMENRQCMFFTAKKQHTSSVPANGTYCWQLWRGPPARTSPKVGPSTLVDPHIQPQGWLNQNQLGKF
jgi:hypothetical protein